VRAKLVPRLAQSALRRSALSAGAAKRRNVGSVYAFRLLPGEPPADAELARLGALRELLDSGYGKATTILAGDGAQPLLIDFRWADATTNTLPGDEAPPPLLEAADEADSAVVVQWAAD
jgi:hypothetical protein